MQLQIDLKGLTAIAGGPPTFVKGEGAEAVLDVLLTNGKDKTLTTVRLTGNLPSITVGQPVPLASLSCRAANLLTATILAAGPSGAAVKQRDDG